MSVVQEVHEMGYRRMLLITGIVPISEVLNVLCGYVYHRVIDVMNRVKVSY